MIVISDATPINVLVRIGSIGVLEDLFGRVLLTPAVLRELSHSRTPQEVRDWATQLPPWVQVRSPRVPDKGGRGAGEREAIALALELDADFLLVDDRQARQDALAQGLSIAGTVGILEIAAEYGLISFVDMIARLRKTDFHVLDSIIEEALKRNTRQGS